MLYKYIGEHGSLGFIKGQVYDLELYLDNYGYIIACSKKYEIPYKSMKIFEMNWTPYKTDSTCLHCGKGVPSYCEECYQKLISENLKLQTNSTLLSMEDVKNDIIRRICINVEDQVNKHIPRID